MRGKGRSGEECGAGGGEDKSTGVEKAKYGMVRKFEKLDKCKKEKV